MNISYFGSQLRLVKKWGLAFSRVEQIHNRTKLNYSQSSFFTSEA
jgi:hypothetical protein